jgi:hypothetical protein
MYQFVHVEVYAKEVSKKAINRRIEEGKQGTKSLISVRDVMAEAKREIDACPHVEDPLPPEHIYGISLDQVEMLAYAFTQGQTDKIGRKLRVDTPILLAGTATYPRDNYEANHENFKCWLDDNVQWLQNEYGKNLKNITMHLDEANPHIHFFAISPTGRAKDIHAGYRAQKQQKSTNTTNKDNKNVYNQAMRDFQERYYRDVGAPNGMLKNGPKKQRLSRIEYKSKKSDAKLMAERMREIEKMDKIVSEELVAFADFKQAETQKDAEKIIENAKHEAKEIKDTFLKKFKVAAEFIIMEARKQAQEIVDQAKAWSKNSHEYMARLINAEKQVSELKNQVETLTLERDEIKKALDQQRLKR